MAFLTKNIISCHELKTTTTHPECGAICSFEGIVRNHHHGKRVLKLVYEAYEPMAEKILAALKAQIETEWPDCCVAVKHRIGELNIGDVAVAIVVWAPHRKEAFAACQAMIDRIKTRVPIWKKEFYETFNRHNRRHPCRRQKPAIRKRQGAGGREPERKTRFAGAFYPA